MIVRKYKLKPAPDMGRRTEINMYAAIDQPRECLIVNGAHARLTMRINALQIGLAHSAKCFQKGY